MKKIKRIDYLTVIKYIAIFALFFVINKLSPEVRIFGVAILVGLLYVETSIFLTPLLYIASLAILSAWNVILPAAIAAAFIMLVFGIYKLNKAKPRYELILYLIAALTPFVILEGLDNIKKSLIVSAITATLGVIYSAALSAITTKGLKFKMSYEQIILVGALVVSVGLGISNLLSTNVWKTIAVFITLLTAYVYRLGISSLVAATLAIPVAIYFGDFSVVGVYTIMSIIVVICNGTSRYISAVAIILTEYLLQLVFSIYSAYSYVDLIFTLVGSVAFTLIPTKFLNEFKEKLYAFRERQLVRQTINRSRYMLSNRLYEISSVFLEIGNVFTSMKKDTLSEDKAKQHLTSEVLNSVCRGCDNYNRCLSVKNPSAVSLDKLFNIGLAKGKISFIDVPTDISDRCVHGNNLIFCVNKLLAEYRNYILESLNQDQSKQLIGSEAVGVAEILKGLALETSQTLKYQNKLERKLADSLTKNGFNATEILIYGENSNLSISMILNAGEIPLTLLQKVVTACSGENMAVAEKATLVDDKQYFIFKVAPKFDAVFGIAKAVKDGSSVSGDTHSITRISGDKFLIAVSDGMGSGNYAESVSNASLSLIESFYKAGMSSELILDTVNKVLSINTEDSFTALDISVIDLKTLSADFIKFGAPYGFIITADGIKLVEGNGLPLGILSELKPTVNTTNLQTNDMLLFFTDGVSDAFKSSSNFIDWLRQKPALNPQTLCDDILFEAERLSDNKHRDDMTLLAVRIFDRKIA